MHRQNAYGLRFDWGLEGAAAVTFPADVSVVVDVLSFTTTLSIAVERGTAVWPYPWRDETAQRYAEEHDAVLAVGRSQARPGQISLSPASLRTTAAPARLVLPSPNGSTIAHHLASPAQVCLAASLRNAAAVVDWIRTRYVPNAVAVAVTASGERWPAGGLRPAVEDLWGAGAVVHGLAAAGWTAISPEAELARVGYEAVRGRERVALLACASGRELVDTGYASDVEIAAEADLGAAVPLLEDGRFMSATGS
jgi:2-phosphosulfolactate phosphatase